MRHAEDGRGWGFVAATGFEVVFHDVDTTDAVDAVFAREDVELVEYLDGIHVRPVSGGDCDGETDFELDGEEVEGGGTVFDGLGELPHVDGRGRVGVSEDACFVGDVEEVFVDRPGLGGGLLDGNGLFGGVREEGLTTRKIVVKLCEGRWVQRPAPVMMAVWPLNRAGSID